MGRDSEGKFGGIERGGALFEYFHFTLPYPLAFSTPFSKPFPCADPRRKNLIRAEDYDPGKEMLRK